MKTIDRILAAVDELFAPDVAPVEPPPSPDWTATADALPSEADADREGNVLAISPLLPEPTPMAWNCVGAPFFEITYWRRLAPTECFFVDPTREDAP